MDFSSLRTLQSEGEYQAALLAVRPFFEKEPLEGSLDAARFDALVLLIEEYEKRVYPVPRAEPVEVIKAVMETNNYSRADLVAILGSRRVRRIF
ncbi:type II toxin-antitoxin system HigA family antitoxin [Rhizobium sp. G21]|uniref:helix-turn-helix domain-containing protein n=1 Tax=Rhizobium sp. G21 TaxID=2758439 RepID=UPI001FF020DE|nr:hypothetical protein [Rhizobium sp. G21]